MPLFRFLHNFLNIDPFLMILVPIESSRSPLSNGIKIIKNGSILRKLWADRVDHDHPCGQNMRTDGWTDARTDGRTDGQSLNPDTK